MNPEARTFAQDILEHANLIQNFLADKTFDDYTNDWVIRSAVERQFSIIGEAMNGLAHHAPSAAATITAQSPSATSPSTATPKSTTKSSGTSPNPPHRSYQPPRTTLNLTTSDNKLTPTFRRRTI